MSTDWLTDEGLVLLVLVVAALATSTLSAVVGFGGGVLLLAVLVLLLDPLEAIVVHGAIQMIGNGTRTHALRHHIDRRVAGPALVLLVPGSLLGLLLVGDLRPDAGRLLIGAFVLAVTWVPSLTERVAAAASTPRHWVLLGGAAGLGNVTVGATGPVFAPFFRAATNDRLAFVGTFAAVQTVGHVVKVVVLVAAGATLVSNLSLAVAGAGGVVLGTRIGTRFLHDMDERAFAIIQRIALTAVGVRLLLAAL